MNAHKAELTPQEINESIDLRPGLGQVLDLIDAATYPRDCTVILRKLPSYVFEKGMTEEEVNIAIARIEVKRAQLRGKGAISAGDKPWSPSNVLDSMPVVTIRSAQDRAANDRHDLDD